MATSNRTSVEVTSPNASKRSSQLLTTEDDGAQQLAVAVDELLDQLQHKFDSVSTEIFGKLDDMAQRIDQLESSIVSARESDQAD